MSAKKKLPLVHPGEVLREEFLKPLGGSVNKLAGQLDVPAQRINEIVRKSGVRDGIVHLQSLHTTTAVFLNEWQDALLHDVKTFLEEIVARETAWRHNDPEHSDCERKNADSHLRGMMMGQTLCLQVRNSAVLLGTWQSIILAEFDGPRSRSMSVQVSGI